MSLQDKLVSCWTFQFFSLQTCIHSIEGGGGGEYIFIQKGGHTQVMAEDWGVVRGQRTSMKIKKGGNLCCIFCKSHIFFTERLTTYRISNTLLHFDKRGKKTFYVKDLYFPTWIVSALQSFVVLPNPSLKMKKMQYFEIFLEIFGAFNDNNNSNDINEMNKQMNINQ